ncbi:bifunctional diaminohydroxyphosphoribosylaminopyrimidine deaminase/5-amino-6-(5-phosphoribosylamino)uracil reductase RibD [Erythrobacter litoralis]|uniref:Riboflavin biosynthesis protein RibD n=1 Tax=Erythrobacter litoralis (strain HTCC2594) TaxID=314225 RepID=Q2NDW9_ERYLH|nr:bifunctional diaminohydroxyphosphoribosylaminopyrimidine deaminase/5-amino-6-(5-phosphoribosylamino)uracil reductase RibD [Erythrobacter litoralis]ABC62122.1 riboflavin-specific deaminase/reductase [Erythrobacter litoralis HTCC2594]
MIGPRGDQDWLAAAARLASRGRPVSAPNPAVGCIIVKQDRVIGRGWTRVGGRPHAEAAALEQAGQDARGATIYVTLEPCAHESDRGPSCADLLVAARPQRVVLAEVDPDRRTHGAGIARLRRSGITVETLPSPAAAASLAGFLTRERLGRPHVTLKLALSLDGCIALASGESQWITGEEARAHCHSRRAMSDAILVGGGTWRADKPRLDVRLPGLEDRSPQRVVLTRGVPIDGVRIINEPAQIDRLEAAQYLYVEGGAGAAASFLAENLVDRLDIYRAPIVIGGGKPAFGNIGLADLTSAHGSWKLVERRQLGSDCYEAYERQRS